MSAKYFAHIVTKEKGVREYSSINQKKKKLHKGKKRRRKKLSIDFNL